MAEIQKNAIAPAEEFKIICPYCFNKACGGDGLPFPHTKVEFRAETCFLDESEIERKLNCTKTGIAMLPSAEEREERMKEFEQSEKYIAGRDERYQEFWSIYAGGTTEVAETNSVLPWERRIIKIGDGITRLEADKNGFLIAAYDDFGRRTDKRVCPHCHNPLPKGYGLNKVKYISIIGITGAGKTVYISQLLQHIVKEARKAALSAYTLGGTVEDFMKNNRVEKDKPLPTATIPERLSQPMFFDVERASGGTRYTDTIVLYDIAGENCESGDKMEKFAEFVRHSDGILLLIDPKQLGFLPEEPPKDEKELPEKVVNTLHSVLETARGEKSEIPIAVCVSKSDKCSDILPPIAHETVNIAGVDVNGFAVRQFNGKEYNILSGKLKELMMLNANQLCTSLQTGYWNFNFFSVSAIGCRCKENESGLSYPVSNPLPKRVEEPIFWLFKQFGYIGCNERVRRPFKIEQPRQPEPEKPSIFKSLFKKEEKAPEILYAEFEEDAILF